MVLSLTTPTADKILAFAGGFAGTLLVAAGLPSLRRLVFGAFLHNAPAFNARVEAQLPQSSAALTDATFHAGASSHSRRQKRTLRASRKSGQGSTLLGEGTNEGIRTTISPRASS